MIVTNDVLSVKVITVHHSGESPERDVIHRPVFFNKCAKNEVWYSCLPTCDITCDNLYRTCKKDDKDRCFKGCDCARGYARLSEGGPCVSVSRCPGKKNN